MSCAPAFCFSAAEFVGVRPFWAILKNATKNCLIWSARPRENSSHVDDQWAAVNGRTVGVNQTQVIHLKFGRPIWAEGACHVAWWSAF